MRRKVGKLLMRDHRFTWIHTVDHRYVKPQSGNRIEVDHEVNYHVEQVQRSWYRVYTSCSLKMEARFQNLLGVSFNNSSPKVSTASIFSRTRFSMANGASVCRKVCMQLNVVSLTRNPNNSILIEPYIIFVFAKDLRPITCITLWGLHTSPALDQSNSSLLKQASGGVGKFCFTNFCNTTSSSKICTNIVLPFDVCTNLVIHRHPYSILKNFLEVAFRQIV